MRTNKTEKKQKLKESKGITLIALVITIIVLLILAGVTIATLTGDNGILKQANKAKIENVKAGERDQIGLAYNAVRTDKLANGDSGNVLEGELEVALEANGKAAKVGSGTDKDGAYLLVKMTDTQNQYKVRNDGKIEDADSLGGNTGGGASDIKTVAEAIEKDVTFTNNTTITDTYGNSITIPAGFRIAKEDSATDVTGGIVIEDATYTNTMGSQFVWIPVGTVYTKADKSESKTIELKRYTFADDGTPNSQEEGALIESYYQELASSSYGNTVAKNIGEFKTKAVASHGYYIGRYEARKSSEGNLTVVGTDNVYNNITQPNAATESRNMYTIDKFTSDLINSYAWDTAIVFEQTFDDRTDKTTPYSRQGNLSQQWDDGSGSGSGFYRDVFVSTGTNNLTDTSMQDKICNVWDMSSNCSEWSTETSSWNGCSEVYSCVSRGAPSGWYDGVDVTGGRQYQFGESRAMVSFRPILYL